MAISLPASGGRGSFILVHGLQQSDWLPTLEATLALDEESVRKVGEETTGGKLPAQPWSCAYRVEAGKCAYKPSRQTYQMFAHRVGILGNAADFYEDGSNSSFVDNIDRRQMMIVFDMRYGLGYFQ
ncbi:hypothetical protein RIF29_39073 [Crotalaria pallida]|uniref:Uncharacterized protein n=1 Tax=Crotalaria pallida TaxID=3830 RepID=A0AAN9E105_CROPI